MGGYLRSVKLVTITQVLNTHIGSTSWNKVFTLPCPPSMAEDDASGAAPKALAVGYLRTLSLMHRCLKSPGGIGLQFSLLIKN